MYLYREILNRTNMDDNKNNKLVTIDYKQFIKKLQKKTSFPYSRAVHKRKIDRKGYDLQKQIKQKRQQLSTESFGHYLDDQIKDKASKDEYAAGGAYKAMLKLFRDAKAEQVNEDAEYSKKLKKFFKGNND